MYLTSGAAESFPEAFDVVVNYSVDSEIIAAPHSAEEGITVDGPAFMLHEVAQYSESLWRELDFIIVDEAGELACVELYRAALENGRRCALSSLDNCRALRIQRRHLRRQQRS